MAIHSLTSGLVPDVMQCTMVGRLREAPTTSVPFETVPRGLSLFPLSLTKPHQAAFPCYNYLCDIFLHVLSTNVRLIIQPTEDI